MTIEGVVVPWPPPEGDKSPMTGVKVTDWHGFMIGAEPDGSFGSLGIVIADDPQQQTVTVYPFTLTLESAANLAQGLDRFVREMTIARRAGDAAAAKVPAR